MSNESRIAVSLPAGGIGPPGTRRPPLRAASAVFLAAAIALSIGVRLHLAATPLERDEGEYAYAGQLVRDGVPAYRLAYDMKFPGTFYAYALFESVAGETPEAIRCGLAATTTVSALLVAAIAQALLGSPAAAAAAGASFAVLALDPAVYGLFAHASHFVVLLVLASLATLVCAAGPPGRCRLLAAGACLGLAIAMKQHAAVFLLPAWALCLAGRALGWGRAGVGPIGRCLLVAAGAVVPLAFMVASLAAGGVLDRFLFWTVTVARSYATMMPLAGAATRFAGTARWVSRNSWPLWAWSGVGLAALPFLRGARVARVLLPPLAVASLLALSSGLFFREHYFIFALPLVALGCGAATRAIADLLSPRWGAASADRVALGLAAILCTGLVVAARDVLFRMSPREVSRAVYGANPFVEAAEVARWIAAHTPPGATIAVLGSEPEIPFLARRRSATGHVLVYPLLEPHPFASTLQREMIAEIETNQPEILVFVQVPSSWLARPTSDPTLLRWGEEFARRCYEQVGIADVGAVGEPIVLWGEAARAYTPESDNRLLTFRKRGSEVCHAPVPEPPAAAP